MEAMRDMPHMPRQVIAIGSRHGFRPWNGHSATEIADLSPYLGLNPAILFVFSVR